MRRAQRGGFVAPGSSGTRRLGRLPPWAGPGPRLAPLRGGQAARCCRYRSCCSAPEVSTKPGYIKFNYNTWLSCNTFYLQISKCFLSIKQASQCPLPSSCGRVCYTLSLFILKAVRRNWGAEMGKGLPEIIRQVSGRAGCRTEKFPWFVPVFNSPGMLPSSGNSCAWNQLGLGIWLASVLICSEMPQWPTHSSQQGCSPFGSYSPIPAQKVWAQACPLPVVAFLHLILWTAGEEGVEPQLKVSLSEAGEPIWL